MRRTPIAWLNLLHERTRLIVAVVGVAFSVLLIFMNLGFRGALIQTATDIYRQFDADVFLISTQSLEISTSDPFPRDRLYQAAGVEGVERVMPVYVSYAQWKNPETRVSRAMFVYGINPKDSVFLMPELRESDAAQRLRGLNTVFMDRLSRPEFGPQDIGTQTAPAFVRSMAEA